MGGGDPFYLKFWVKPRWSEIADFGPIFVRSASAGAPSKKSSINTNRKSTMPGQQQKKIDFIFWGFTMSENIAKFYGGYFLTHSV